MTHSTLTMLKHKDVVRLLLPLYEFSQRGESELYGSIFQMTELSHRQVLVFMWQQQLGLTTDLERLIRDFGGNVNLLVKENTAMEPVRANSGSASAYVMSCVNQQQELAHAYAHALKSELPQNVRMVLSTHAQHVQTIIRRLHAVLPDLAPSVVIHPAMTTSSSTADYADFLPQAM